LTLSLVRVLVPPIRLNNYGLIIDQRLPSPVQTDKRKEPALDLVPLTGSRRIVTDRDRYPDLIRHLLRVDFPGTQAISVVSSLRAGPRRDRLYFDSEDKSGAADLWRYRALPRIITSWIAFSPIKAINAAPNRSRVRRTRRSVLPCGLAGFFLARRSGGPEQSLLDIYGFFVQQLGRVLDLLPFHRYIAYGKA